MKKRYIIYISLILMIVSGFWLVKPVLPVVQLPGEILIGFDLPASIMPGLTNTFVATVLTWIVVIVLLLAVGARSRTADEVPTGLYNVIEMILEGVYNFVEGQAGKWTKQFFPWFVTFLMVILIANWMELVPGVDSIGYAERGNEIAEHQIHDLEDELGRELTEDEKHEIEEKVAKEKGGRFGGPLNLFLLDAEPGEKGEHIIPYVRAAATDLNFTFALAIISVVMTQVYGFRANGMAYLGKFFTWQGDKIAKSPLSIMDSLVGILEFISELAKILSFAFRLFGNIFAGQVLLFVIGVLAPVANIGVFGLEFFVGAIQAAVFAMLTLTFMSQAVQEPHH